MNANDANDKQTSEMIEYRLRLMAADERARFAKRLAEDDDFQARYHEVTGSLDALDEYNILAPKDLQENILSAVRTGRLIETQRGQPAKRGDRLAVLSGFRELLAAAAAILIVVSTWTVTARSVRHQSLKTLCSSQLGAVGTAIARYAHDHRDNLPVAKVAGGETWYDAKTGRPRRPHLFIIVKNRYVSPRVLVCPAGTKVKLRLPADWREQDDFHPAMHVTYSFQNLYGDNRFSPRQRRQRWDSPAHMAIMADQTPLLQNDKLLHAFKPLSQSPNHDRAMVGKGQNILFLDGRVIWQQAPVVGLVRDNIWQAGTLDTYTGTEVPTEPTDSFLAP